jgi:hypothetical protein
MSFRRQRAPGVYFTLWTSPSASLTIWPGASAARASSSGALEALALEEFKHGHLARPELRRLLGFGTRAKLDEFLTVHEVFGTYTRRIWSATAKTCDGSASEAHAARRRRAEGATLKELAERYDVGLATISRLTA